jgi:hypothetical protein
MIDAVIGPVDRGFRKANTCRSGPHSPKRRVYQAALADSGPGNPRNPDLTARNLTTRCDGSI